MSAREDRIAVFESTKQLYASDASLKKSIEDSINNQKFHAAEETLGLEVPSGKKSRIIVSAKRTFEASESYAKAGRKTAVLNFASATTPGGGVQTGASAQEECLCRISTLYPCLDSPQMWERFYAPHRNDGTPLHNDDIIYTPGVTVFKTDSNSPMLLPEDARYNVNVITCAAPNLREKPSNSFNMETSDSQVHISDEDLKLLHVKRAKRILSVAAMYGNECIILGAFGCGAFCNDPHIVAEAYLKALEDFRGVFDTIEFAVFCGRDDLNYRAFMEVLG